MGVENVKKYKLIAMLSITFILFISIIFNGADVSKTLKTPPQVVDGVIDLRNWDFDKDGIIKLNGQWEFYEDQLVSPQDFSGDFLKNKRYSAVPGIFGGQAFGTYRIKVLTNNTEELYSAKIDYIQNAFKLWSNMREVMSVGSVGKSKKEMEPQLHPQEGYFYMEKGENYLTLQVSNFYISQGFIDTVLLGRAIDIKRYTEKRLAFDLFLFGCTIFAAIYNIGVYNKRKKDKAPLYFAIVCIIVAIRTVFVGESFFLSLFSNFPFAISTKIKILTFYIYVPFIVGFINNTNKNTLNDKIVRLSNISWIVYAIIVIFSPIDYYLYYILPFESLAIFMLIYMMIKISKVFSCEDQSDCISVVGIFALLIARINDILYEYSIIITGSYAPLGIFIFIIVNYFVLAEKQSMAFNSIEKISEKLESINNLKDEFLAITSHELKTPLNGIIGLSESLVNDNKNNLSTEQEYNLNLINSSAKRLSNLVNDIMIFSRLKNNEIILDKKPINISKIVEMVIKSSEPFVSGKKIILNNMIDSNVPFVFGDENRLQQIFYNLIGNAVKFTHFGEVKVSYSEHGEYLQIIIEDTGIGIEEDKLEKIFNLYEQVEGVSEKYGGTGLGLYITKKLVELHGGIIQVESQVNKGSSFKFTIPLCTIEQLEKFNDYNAIDIRKQNLNVSINRKSLKNQFASKELMKNLNKISIKDISNKNITNNKERKFKILIVDDEYVNLKVLENYLSNENYDIYKASNGKDALTLIEEQEDLDLVILDMMMPDLFGYEVCKIIREKRFIFDLPILIMTADNRVDNLVLSFESGANDYLRKPFNKYELKSRVNTLLTLKQSVKEALLLTKEITNVNKEVQSLNIKNAESVRKVEELIEYDKIKTEFFANISHELRTPLNVISSTIQLLLSLDEDRCLGDERIKYYFSIMKQNSLRLLRLINNLIDTTKIEGGYLNLNFKNSNIVYVVEEISQSVAEFIKTHEIALIFDTDIEEKYIAFDEEKIERVILNILSNAVKFTEKGGNIFVSIYDKEDSIVISIKDTGIGIPKDKLDFIFERFAQVDKSTTRKAEGSGIGLALVKSIIELHGGTISVNSEVGKGSEFIISLPVTLANYKDENAQTYNDTSNPNYVESLSIEFSDIYLTK